jgi:hypothetical protein
MILFEERKSTDVSQEMSPASAGLKSKPSKNQHESRQHFALLM